MRRILLSAGLALALAYPLSAQTLTATTSINLLKGSSTIEHLPSWDACEARAKALAQADTRTSGTVTYRCQTEVWTLTAAYAPPPTLPPPPPPPVEPPPVVDPPPPPRTSACLASDGCYPKNTRSGVGATGTPDGITLAPCTSSPAPGAVLSGCLWTGSLTISASNVTIRNSEIRGRVINNGKNLVVEDTTIGPLSGCLNTENIGYSDYTVRRVWFRNSGEGPRVSGDNVTVEDSFIGPMCSVSGDHADGVQGYQGGTNIVVRHNTIDQRTAGGNVTSPIFFADSSQSADVEDNLVAGGGYSLRLHDDFTPDKGPWKLLRNRIVDKAWSFGPMYNDGTTFTAETCVDNRIVTIDSNYTILTTGAVVDCN